MGMNSQQLQLLSVACPTISSEPILYPPASRQFLVHSLSAINNGVPCHVGLGVMHSYGSYKVIRTDGSSGTAIATDITDQIITGPATVIANNAGDFIIYVQSKNRFNGVTMNLVTPADAGALFLVEYWNGSVWKTVDTITQPLPMDVPTMNLTIMTPIDWNPGANGEIPNFSSITPGYTLRISAQTASAGDVEVMGVNLFRFFAVRKDLTTGQALNIRFTERPMLLESQEAIMAYFSRADNFNMVEVSYQVLL